MVKRYDCGSNGYTWCEGCYRMNEDGAGDYVRFADYDALAARLAGAERLLGESQQLCTIDERNAYLNSVERYFKRTSDSADSLHPPCEFCGAKTGIAARQCCERGRAADSADVKRCPDCGAQKGALHRSPCPV